MPPPLENLLAKDIFDMAFQGFLRRRGHATVLDWTARPHLAPDRTLRGPDREWTEFRGPPGGAGVLLPGDNRLVVSDRTARSPMGP